MFPQWVLHSRCFRALRPHVFIFSDINSFPEKVKPQVLHTENPSGGGFPASACRGRFAPAPNLGPYPSVLGGFWKKLDTKP